MRCKSSRLSQGKNPSAQGVRTQVSVWGPGPQQTPQAAHPCLKPTVSPEVPPWQSRAAAGKSPTTPPPPAQEVRAGRAPRSQGARGSLG